MKKLSRSHRSILDVRYIFYDPDVILTDGDESWIRLVCPVHGPYQTQVKYLTHRHTKRSIRAPRCPGCFRQKVTDQERLYEIDQQWQVAHDPEMALIWEPTEEWHVLEHWVRPIAVM